jgi:hypothetical protein
LRDGFGHQPFNRTLPQLTQNGTKQEILLVVCRARKEFADQTRDPLLNPHCSFARCG